MGTTNAQLFSRLSDSLNVRHVRDLMVSVLGLQTSADPQTTAGSNDSCFQDCSSSPDCLNETCICPCSHELNLGTAFASCSYLVLVISIIQLILVMVYDSLKEDKPECSRWKKAFRMTLQKCLLGSVIMATGTRAIYYSVLTFIPTKWGEILLNLYYPALLSAFSLLICFWADFFYASSSTPSTQGCDFLKKHRYSLTFFVFNIVVYLLLVADVIATPLISDSEQIRMSGIISTIFAFFLLLTLVGFLHFSIRLFFRPDWQPLSVQLQVLKINLRQQVESVAGILSNALMQSLIICLLVVNMVGRFQILDSNSVYVCAIVIRVTELIMPFWFCCSLWNYKQPKKLWILNPRLVLNLKQDSESKPLLSSRPHSDSYGTISLNSEDPGSPLERSTGSISSEDGYCWVCQGVIEDPKDLYYPCNCRLHRKCIKEWVSKRASNVNIPEKEYLRCQVCHRRYRVKRYSFVCLPKGLQRKHWLQIGAVLLILGISVGGCVYTGSYTTLETKVKIAIICSVVCVDIVVFKLFGFGMIWLYRRNRHTVCEIKGISVDKWKKIQAKMAEREESSSPIIRSRTSNSVQYSVTHDTVVTGLSEPHSCQCVTDGQGPTHSIVDSPVEVHPQSSSCVNS